MLTITKLPKIICNQLFSKQEKNTYLIQNLFQ